MQSKTKIDIMFPNAEECYIYCYHHYRYINYAAWKYKQIYQNNFIIAAWNLELSILFLLMAIVMKHCNYRN